MRLKTSILVILLVSAAPVSGAVADDARLLAAQYLEQSTTPGEAAERLLTDEQAGEVEAASAQRAQDSIRDYAALDRHARARFIADALWNRWSVARYNGFWLDQARDALEAGDGDDAERALRHLRKPWDAATAARRYSLWGRLYQMHGRHDHAVIALDKQATMGGDGLFDHYNFAYSLLQAGERERGFALFDDIGQLPLDSEDHRALRDQANLALGWHWLAQDQGGTARAFFRRVRLEGPLSNPALLGLGWAELAADGTPQRARFKRRVLCEKPEVAPDALMRLLSDRYAACRPGEISGVFSVTHDFAFDAAAHGPARYQEALRPWRVLAQREAADPYVQEALLAVAFARQQSEGKSQAGQSYDFAIRRYEAETARLRELERVLQASDSDPFTVLAARARPGEFAAVRGSHRFVRMQASRTLLDESRQQLRQSLDRIQAEPAEAIRAGQLERLRDAVQTQLDSAQDLRRQQDQLIRQWLLVDLLERRERLDRYHSRARLALARLYDKP